MSKQQTFNGNGGAAALEARFALQVAAVLDSGAQALPKDITTRLRFAREKALERARSADHSVALGNGQSAVLGGAGSPGGWGARPWLLRLASLLPLLALVGGLTLIQHLHQRSQIDAAADIDAALLADELPPVAYSDPGFVEFLKLPRD